MSNSSMTSISLMPLGQSCQRAVIFNVELKRGHVLSQVFMSLDIIVELVFEYLSIEPVVIQKLDMRGTLLVFP